MNLIRKRYDALFILSMVVALLLCGCRSATLHSSRHLSQERDSTDISLLQSTHGSITSQVRTHTDLIGNRWKITWHFDTSKPTDTLTGLPPTSKLEVEGSETQLQKENLEKVSHETSDTLAYLEKKSSQSVSDEQQTEQPRPDTGRSLRRIFLPGIILSFLILIISRHARKNPSK